MILHSPGTESAHPCSDNERDGGMDGCRDGWMERWIDEFNGGLWCLWYVSVWVCVCERECVVQGYVCVCVCVCEGEGGRERERGRGREGVGVG